MRSHKHDRRKFLAALSAGTAGGLLINAISPFSARAQSNSFNRGQEQNSDYLFSNGLIYLNTGPCRRETIE